MPLNPEDAGQLQEFLDQAVLRGVVGLSVSLWDGEDTQTFVAGEIAKGSGQAVTPATPFAIQGLIKPLIGLVCLKAELDGRLDLDAPLIADLPELAHRDGDEDITARVLLTHTGGFRDPYFRDALAFDWTGLVGFFRDRAQIFPPGMVFGHVQTGHMLLAAWVERRLSAPIETLIDTEILSPLGISLAPGGTAAGQAVLHEFADGGLRIVAGEKRGVSFGHTVSTLALTTSDAAKFGVALVHQDSPLPAALREAALAQPVALPPSWGMPNGEADHRTAGPCFDDVGGLVGAHGDFHGGGFALRFDPDLQAVVAVASLGHSGPLRDRIIHTTMGKLLGTARRRPVPALAPLSFHTVAGRYEGLALGAPPVSVNSQGYVEIGEPPFAAYLLDRGPKGELFGFGKGPASPLAFFPSPVDNAPLLRLGAGIYRRLP